MKDKYIYGLHAVQAALEHSPQNIKSLWIQQDKKDPKIQQILDLAAKHNISVQPITSKKLDQMLPHCNHQGVAAISIKTTYHESDLSIILKNIPTPPLLLILDGIQDPHNLGACLRTANAAGVHAVIAPKDKAAGLTPTVCKVASGAAETTPFIQVTNLVRTIQQLKEQGIWIYGTAHDAPKSIYAMDFTAPIAIVLGSEDKGLRRLTREHCDELISIPMAGTVSNLNVSVATGICLFEAIRQRSQF